MKSQGKNILVIMPFKSKSKSGESKAALDYFRIEYILEKKIPRGIKTGDSSLIDESDLSTNYKVNVFKTGVGNIVEEAAKHISKNDLFIALINESNMNVIYEIAILHMLQEKLILLLDFDSNKDRDSILPVYLQSHAYIDFYGRAEESEDHKIKHLIEILSNGDNSFYLGQVNYDNAPHDLIEKIDKHDTRLIGELSRNIDDLEQGRIEPPAYFRSLLDDFLPRRALSSWETYTPYSVLRIKWKKRQLDRTHLPEDQDGEAEVVWCNNAFCRLLSKPEKPKALLDGAILTLDVQMKMLEEYIDDEKLKLLKKDQNRIYQELFLKNKQTQAWIPIELTSEHAAFSNKAFLPTMIAKKAVGSPYGPHDCYYIIAFIEDFVPSDQITKEQRDILDKYDSEK